MKEVLTYGRGQAVAGSSRWVLCRGHDVTTAGCSRLAVTADRPKVRQATGSKMLGGRCLHWLLQSRTG